MKQNLILAIAFLALGGVAHAEEQQQSNTNQMKIEDAKPANQADTKKDIDEEITNARMRAQLGSKSKWSVKTAFGYNGGSIERPALEVRPNYRAAKSPDVLTNASASVGINYRMEKGSLSFGTGLLVRNPFHGDLTRSKFQDPRGNGRPTTDRIEVSTPYLSWSNGYKLGALQMSTDVTYSHYTTSDATDYDRGLNAVGDVSLSQTVLADLGESSWSAGVSLAVGSTIYKGDLSEQSRADGNAQTTLDYGLYPFAEYSFNDTYSFRTVFGYFEASVYKDDSAGNVQAPVPYQSMGIGMALTRDIYLYPNIQFAPLDIRPERTNVALSANVNMF